MEAAVQHLRACDPVMAAVIARVGPYSRKPLPATFETLARSIVFQQLNGKAAGTFYGRLVEAAGAPLTPQGILRLRLPTLRKAGLSGRKASYIRDLAKRTHAGEVRFEELPALADEEVIAALTQVKGIGVWTAQMFLMFALERPDVLPTADYGIRSAMQKAYRLRKLPLPRRMEQLAQPWRPHRTVACWYLWRSLDTVVET
jgi:DNA-3-methyladenine glycosylase II